MAMFDKRKEPEAHDDEPTIRTQPSAPARPAEPTSRTPAMIGKTIRIKGDITGEENLVIDGHVEGSVTLKSNDLTIGQSGRVHANVSANVVRIEGEVRGDIAGVEKVVITRTGRVQGNIVGPRVTLEDGAKFKGSIDMDPGEASQPAASQRPAAVSQGPAEDKAGGTAAKP